MKETKIVELVIADDNQELAIDAISLVSSPAIEQDFIYFGKEKNNLTFAKVDEEKRMLVSPALIPNKQIFRYDPNTDSEYYVYFSPDTVRKASELYLKHNNHHKATYEHQDRVSGVLTVESWIKEGDSDKSKMYGYDLPNGTWFVKMKITNDELWNKIKDGELKGLSIEGYFTNKFEAMQRKNPTDAQILSALNEIIQEAKKTELKSKKVELSLIDDLKDAEKFYKVALNMAMDVNEELENIVSMMNATSASASKAEESLKVLSKIEKQSKELGVSVNDIPEYKKAINFKDYVVNIQKSIDKNIGKIKQAKL